jgi:Bifunctional DNA primase/polymerase, N-terminal
MFDDDTIKTKHPTSGNLQGADYETSQFPLNNTADAPKKQEEGAFNALKRIGFNPIPVMYGGKDAAVKWKPYQSTRATDAECAVWDAGHYNVGIVTGALSGIFVVDVDGLKGETTLATLEAQHGALPETVRAKSGKGWHYYFAYPTDGRVIRNLAGQSVYGEVLQGLDVRGEGGYIVAPPSLHPNGTHYEWENSPFDMPPTSAPEWLLELVVQPEKTASIAPTPAKEQNNSVYLQAALEGELHELRLATEGQRNNALNKAAYSLGQLVAQGLEEHVIASELLQVASMIGLGGQEAVTTIASGIEAGKQTPRILPPTPHHTKRLLS